VDDVARARRFLKSPPPGAPGQRYKLVAYVSEGHIWWDRATEPPSSEDDEDWMDHRLRALCDAPSIGELLSAFGRFMATDIGDAVEKADAMIMSGGDYGNYWSSSTPEVISLLQQIDDPGRRIAAYVLLASAPLGFSTSLKECETYFRYLPAAFPDHTFVAAWEAAAPHHEEGYAIVLQGKAPAPVKNRPKTKKKAMAKPRAKAAARRSSSPRRASRRKPRRRS